MWVNKKWFYFLSLSHSDILCIYYNYVSSG